MKRRYPNDNNTPPHKRQRIHNDNNSIKLKSDITSNDRNIILQHLIRHRMHHKPINREQGVTIKESINKSVDNNMDIEIFPGRFEQIINEYFDENKKVKNAISKKPNYKSNYLINDELKLQLVSAINGFVGMYNNNNNNNNNYNYSTDDIKLSDLIQPFDKSIQGVIISVLIQSDKIWIFKDTDCIKINYPKLCFNHMMVHIGDHDEFMNDNNNKRNNNASSHIINISKSILSINEAINFGQPPPMIDFIASHFKDKQKKHEAMMQNNKRIMNECEDDIKKIISDIDRAQMELNNLSKKRENYNLKFLKNISNENEIKTEYLNLFNLIYKEQEIKKQIDNKKKEKIFKEKQLLNFRNAQNIHALKRFGRIIINNDKTLPEIGLDLKTGSKYLCIFPPYLAAGAYAQCYLGVEIQYIAHEQKARIAAINKPILIKAPKDITKPRHIKNIFDEYNIHKIIKAIRGTSKLAAPHLIYQQSQNRNELVPCLALEYISNSRDISDCLKGGILFTMDQSIKILYEMILISISLLKLNIIHLDIALENYLLSMHDLSVHLIDYGCAKQLNHKHEIIEVGIVGHPNSAAPETRTATASYKSDIFSIGCVIYMIYMKQPIMGSITLTNEVKFEGDIKKWKEETNDEFRALIFDMVKWKASERPSYPSILQRVKKLL